MTPRLRKYRPVSESGAAPGVRSHMERETTQKLVGDRSGMMVDVVATHPMAKYYEFMSAVALFVG